MIGPFLPNPEEVGEDSGVSKSSYQYSSCYVVTPYREYVSKGEPKAMSTYTVNKRKS